MIVKVNFVDGIRNRNLTSEEKDIVQLVKGSVAGKTIMEVLDHSSKELSGLSR